MTKKSICLYFQVHQPTRLRLYRFFDIGKDSHYYDDYSNRAVLKRVVNECYLPMNALLKELLDTPGSTLKASFSIDGSTLELLERYSPETIASFRELSSTGRIEFLCEPYYHSLASLRSESEFSHQVLKHKTRIEDLFGVTPTTFRNTELIYSDTIGAAVYDMGFKTMVTEGAPGVLGSRSTDYVYSNALKPGLKLLLRNYSLCDDLTVRFSNKSWDVWPLTAEKYFEWLSSGEGDVVNLFLDYEVFGMRNRAESGIFDFFRSFVGLVSADTLMNFVTPTEAVKTHKCADSLKVDDTISWASVESDVSAWLGNELQQDAFNKLYDLTEKLSILDNPVLWVDFGHLQESDHFFYMNTKFFSDGEQRTFYNPYNTPYEAFINYMNVLSDFIIRVNDTLEIKNK